MAERRERERGITVRDRERGGRPMLWPEDIERFFTRAMQGFRRSRPWMAPREEWLPDIDVFEQEGKIVMRVDLPGMKREDIDVAVEGDMLVVRGQRREEREVREEDYYCAERSVGAFYRSIRLPDGVNSDDIEATYHDGVLEVRIPRPVEAESRGRKIAVR